MSLKFTQKTGGIQNKSESHGINIFNHITPFGLSHLQIIKGFQFC